MFNISIIRPTKCFRAAILPHYLCFRWLLWINQHLWVVFDWLLSLIDWGWGCGVGCLISFFFSPCGGFLGWFTSIDGILIVWPMKEKPEVLGPEPDLGSPPFYAVSYFSAYHKICTETWESPLPWDACIGYWMIYREPDFLAIVWFGSSPIPFPKLSLFLMPAVCLCVAGSAYWQERGVGRNQIIRPRESWPSINHAVLSGYMYWGQR
jgi:hypothetical protein